MTHVIVADLGFGDAGKGTAVDYLCSPRHISPAHAVIRYNGGAQAGHNVVAPDGRHHTFSQFGSGTFHGARTHLSRFALVDPAALAAEAKHLAALGVPDPLGSLTVDPAALIVTPYHIAANRARELARGGGRHGSCGMGIGETASYALRWPADAPRAADCGDWRGLPGKLARLRERLTADLGQLDAPPLPATCAAFRAFADAVTIAGGDYLAKLLHDGPVVFEGAQGVLLDERHGFHPYTTWSDTTFGNAEALLAEARERALRLGVIRPYMVRHGPGPLPTEDESLHFPEPHNVTGPWQGAVRYGHLDAVLLRYALQVTGGADALAITHLDAAKAQPLRLCRAYRHDGQRVPSLPAWLEPRELTAFLAGARPVYETPAQSWPKVIAHETGAPVLLRSHGPTYLDKTMAFWPAETLTGAHTRVRVPA